MCLGLLQLLPAGPLLQHICRRKCFSEHEAREVVKEIAIGLNFLHCQGQCDIQRISVSVVLSSEGRIIACVSFLSLRPRFMWNPSSFCRLDSKGRISVTFWVNHYDTHTARKLCFLCALSSYSSLLCSVLGLCNRYCSSRP